METSVCPQGAEVILMVLTVQPVDKSLCFSLPLLKNLLYSCSSSFKSCLICEKKSHFSVGKRGEQWLMVCVIGGVSRSDVSSPL